jgi:hypothetical protein
METNMVQISLPLFDETNWLTINSSTNEFKLTYSSLKYVCIQISLLLIQVCVWT